MSFNKRYGIPILERLDGKTPFEQLQYIQSLSPWHDLGLDRKRDLWGNLNQNEDKANGLRPIYFESRWFHLMPNYEYCSKNKEILPLFKNDKEKIIYLFLMTNNPIQSTNINIDLYKSKCGGFLNISLYSNDSKNKLSLIKHGYVNPEFLMDLKRYKIKLIQMSGIKDFFNIIQNSAKIAFKPVYYQVLKEYKDHLYANGYQSKSYVGWDSPMYLDFYESKMHSGYINYPLIQFIDSNKWGLNIIEEKLKILLEADTSRIHQLPLPIEKIILSEGVISHVDYEYDSLSSLTLYEKIQSFFWPKGISNKFESDVIRSPNMPISYPGLSFKNLF